MFKTAKNTIKKAAKDQVEFFLVLLTGLFAGSIFTLAYIKYWDTSKVTFADIGGMLAGVGTIGLFIIAVKTAKTWKEQNIHHLKVEYANELSAKVVKYFSVTSSIVQKLGIPHSKGNFEYSNPSSMELFGMVNKASDTRSDLEATLIRYEIIVKKAIPKDLIIDDSFIETLNTYIEFTMDDEHQFLEIQKMHNKLKEQAICSLKQTYKELIKL